MVLAVIFSVIGLMFSPLKSDLQDWLALEYNSHVNKIMTRPNNYLMSEPEPIIGKLTNSSQIITNEINDEKDILKKIYDIGRGVAPEKICDKSVIDSYIRLTKDIENAPEGEDVSGFCNDVKDFSNEDKSERMPIYFWDESKKEFIKDTIYVSNAFGGKKMDKHIIDKCKEAGINIR